MAKFSVCRIYKVTLWLNFSYNYSVNLLQILHLYIHPLQRKYRKAHNSILSGRYGDPYGRPGDRFISGRLLHNLGELACIWVYGQVARKSSHPKLCCLKPELSCPKIYHVRQHPNMFCYIKIYCSFDALASFHQG